MPGKTGRSSAGSIACQGLTPACQSQLCWLSRKTYRTVCVCARVFFKAFVDHQIYIYIALQFFPPILDKFPMHVGFLMAHVQGGQHMSGLPVASCPHNPITWMILGSQILFRNPRCNLKSSRWVRFTDYNYIYIISELVEAINE